MINSQFRVDVRCGNKDPNTQKITWVTEKDHNLINNNGLAMLASYWVAECTENVYLESGGRVNARYSGSTNISQSGTSITSDAAFFLSNQDDANYNRLIVWDSGQQTFITGYNDVDDVDAGTSQSVSAGPATIYYVEELRMDGFVKASTTYDTNPGSNENSWAVASNVLTITNKRTVEFPVESTAVTYKGVGWTPIAGNDQDVFGRKVVDIPVAGGTQPIVEVTITRKIDVASTAFTNIFSGVSSDGDYMNLMGSSSYSSVAYYSSVNPSTGASVAPTAASTFLECKSTEDVKLAIGEYNSSLSLSNIDITGSTYATKTVTPSYTAGNFYADYIATFTRNDIETANLYTIAILNNSDNTEAFWRYLFDTAEDFISKRFNNLTIRKSWSRYF